MSEVFERRVKGRMYERYKEDCGNVQDTERAVGWKSYNTWRAAGERRRRITVERESENVRGGAQRRESGMGLCYNFVEQKKVNERKYDMYKTRRERGNLITPGERREKEEED